MNNKNNNFDNRCYQKLTLIPKGMVSTYAEIAKSLNSKAYRAVGNAMAKNPNPILIPCHRIVKSDGTIGGYALGTNKKIKLLKNEGILIKDGKVINLESKLYRFN